MKSQAKLLLGLISITLLISSLQSTCLADGTMSYQGRIQVNGAPFTGTGQFKFALVGPPVKTTRRALGRVVVEGGVITAVTILDGGAGYDVAPSVVFNDSTGSGASAIAEINFGLVTGVIIRGGGNGYSSRPDVRFSEPPERFQTTTYWSNDGTSNFGSPPLDSVSLTVEEGLLIVQLGDTDLAGMSESIPASAFPGGPVFLRIWFDDRINGLSTLSPDQPLGTSGYALLADQVRNNTIGSDAIMQMAVTTSKLGDDAVTAQKIADGAVGNQHLANGSVTEDKLVNFSVTGVKLASAAVSNSRLADSSVTTAKIADGTIHPNDLSPAFNATFWNLDGNSGTTAGPDFLGTTDNEPLELKVQNQRALRLEPGANSPNIIGGFGSVSSGVYGAAIGGGGNASFPNLVGGNYGFVGSGFGNQVIGGTSFIGGGSQNLIESGSSKAVIGGGDDNKIGGSNASSSFIGGGLLNTNEARFSFLGGGSRNFMGGGSEYSFIGAGSGNRIESGSTYSVIPGGRDNEVDGDYSFAAGRQAKARHQGTFVWADDSTTDFVSTANDQFLIKANGGVGIGTSNPDAHLHILGNGSASKPQLLLRETTVGNRSRLQMKASGLIWEMSAGGGGGVPNSFDFAYGGNTLLSLDDAGELFTKVLTITGGADVSEPFPMTSKNLPKGSLVVIDENNPGQLSLSDQAYDFRVAGIISGANGVNPGLTLSQQGVMDGDQQVALTGRVYALADAAYGAIKPGDLLTTSDTPGHAMAATDPSRAHGTVVGKAMTSLPEGKGLVLVLVSLH